MHLQAQEVSSQSRHREGGTAGVGPRAPSAAPAPGLVTSHSVPIYRTTSLREVGKPLRKQSLKKRDQGNNEVEMP